MRSGPFLARSSSCFALFCSNYFGTRLLWVWKQFQSYGNAAADQATAGRAAAGATQLSLDAACADYMVASDEPATRTARV